MQCCFSCLSLQQNKSDNYNLTSNSTVFHKKRGSIYLIMNTFIHQNGRLTDRDNIYNRLKTYYMQSLLVLREWLILMLTSMIFGLLYSQRKGACKCSKIYHITLIVYAPYLRKYKTMLLLLFTKRSSVYMMANLSTLDQLENFLQAETKNKFLQIIHAFIYLLRQQLIVS